jgi:hypothetical protein
MEAFYTEQRDWMETGKDFQFRFISHPILSLRKTLGGSLSFSE